MYWYYKEKFHANHFWELKVNGPGSPFTWLRYNWGILSIHRYPISLPLVQVFLIFNWSSSRTHQRRICEWHSQGSASCQGSWHVCSFILLIFSVCSLGAHSLALFRKRNTRNRRYSHSLGTYSVFGVNEIAFCLFWPDVIMNRIL